MPIPTNILQFGFRQHYSTTFALIDVVDDIYKHLDNNETGIGIPRLKKRL